MSIGPWFKCYPKDWLAIAASLGVKEQAALFTISMRLYDAQGPLPLPDRAVARWLGINVRGWKTVKAALVEAGCLVELDSGLFTTPLFDPANLPGVRSDVTAAVKLAIFERDQWRCVYCGTDAGPFECDHIVPVSRGGSGSLENLACACVNCNRSKGSKTLKEWKGAQS